MFVVYNLITVTESYQAAIGFASAGVACTALMIRELITGSKKNKKQFNSQK